MPAPNSDDGDFDEDELQDAFEAWEEETQSYDRMLELNGDALDGDEDAIEDMADELDDFFS